MSKRIHVVLTDIEGTVSSLSFVRDVLFPYARQRMSAFLAGTHQQPEVAAAIAETRRLAGLDDSAPLDVVAETLCQWIDEDRKAPPLKELQGKIWRSGYESGELVADIYPDALEALRAWDAAGVPLYVYSSGSVEAQLLFFAHTRAGDLCPLFQEHFDTQTGAKSDPGSYQTICAISGYGQPEVLFLTDSCSEAAAASEAGLPVVLLARDNVPADVPPGVPVVSSFADIPPDLDPLSA